MKDAPAKAPAFDAAAPSEPGFGTSQDEIRSPAILQSTSTFFHPGENCWRVERADQIGLVVDGEEYFQAFAEAVEAAQESIFILSWDFDSRIGLRFDAGGKPTTTAGELLNRWVRGGRHRRVYILIWDYPMIYGLEREFPPIYGVGWRPERRIQIHYDDTIPLGASHHQKIVVIDDRVAFAGGLDLTGRRWDSCAHKAREPRRIVRGQSYPPFHDAMMAVSGPAAKALGELARERWRNATGQMPMVPNISSRAPRWRIPIRRPPVPSPDRWPDSLAVALRETDVAIARTLPAAADRPDVREVERLYLDLIRAARCRIYIENQYFTAHTLGEALAERLQEPDGPEIVVVLRLLSHGWLEALSMERLRSALIGRLREADRYGRFQVYYPFVAGLPDGECLDVHAKLMVVDDRFLRIGSANFANRSMGFDTECDLTLDAGSDPDRTGAVSSFRTRLVAEHLGATPEAVAAAEERQGSLIAAIDELRRAPESLESDGRTLQVLEVGQDASGVVGELLHLADPEDAVPLDGLIREFQPSPEIPVERGPAWLLLLGVGLLLAALAALWRWTPLASVASGEAIAALAHEAASTPWMAPALVICYVIATFVVFPRPLLTLVAVLAFGPWIGFGLSLVGVLAATWANYLVGRKLPRRLVRRLAGRSLNRITEVLREREVLAITALRLVPIAPFAVPGLVAGAIRLRLGPVLLGTVLGNAPGILVTTVLGDRLQAILDHPEPADYWLFAAVVIAAAVTAYLARRYLVRLRLPHSAPR
jgi:phosphatidylserine/phosphatidylglycerophosphate/cardiolipin synthase-like enzyme/uncharacterized membrane protein YdjX (TVP38/TMEM64 family)